MTDVMPPGPLAYTGQIAVPSINRTFPPTSSNNQFSVPTLWIDTNAEAAYVLVGKPLGVADWLFIGTSAGDITQITIPGSIIIEPTSGNVNFTSTGGTVAITGSGSTIDFEVTSAGMTWNNATANVTPAVKENGYAANKAGSACVITLPTVGNTFGDTISIMGFGAEGWVLAAGTGQIIEYGNAPTSTGGSLSSTNQYDQVIVRCSPTTTTWVVANSIGNLTVA